MIKLKEFLKDDSGATAIEYGLIAAFISVAMIAAVSTIGTNISSHIGKAGASIKGANDTAGG